jgi:hypothetical protein
MTSPELILFLSSALAPVNVQSPPVNPGAAILQDFGKRVDEYIKLRKTVESGLPKLKQTSSPAEITEHEQEFARAIREARKDVKQGDIFAPEISAEFRRLIGIAMRGADAVRIKESLRSAEPVNVPLRVNSTYPAPAKVPLQSTPPTLLMNLPKLPPELDYRVVGHNLALRDVKANLIIDLIHNAIP